MNNRCDLLVRCLCFGLCLWAGSGSLRGQTTPEFNRIQRLTNKEVLLRLTGPTGANYRIDASTNLPAFESLVTLPRNAGFLQYTDSAAPYFNSRFYRAQQLSGTNITGDHLATTDGDVVIHPLYHASFVMTWNGMVIYNDPDDDSQYAARYQGLPKADLILISHSHGDHYSAGQIAAVRGSNAVIVVPQAVYDQGSFAPFRPNAIILRYGVSTNVLGLTIQAVPAYNGNHSFGINNAYVLTIGGKRILTTGDSGDTPEIRALTNIDVAFVCMNTPFTMTVNEATNSVRRFRPKIVYPYHYRNQSGTLTNAAFFKQILGTDLGIEVRLRGWY
jgi:L-ascorbate metabolism protein UlaG (beta-lactamase superfamily)